MNEIDFYRLPRAVQERLLDSLAGRFAPSPLARVQTADRPTWLWLAASTAAAVCLILLYRGGFGDLHSRFSAQGPVFAVLYGALGAVFVLGLLQTAARRNRTLSLPFAPGIYVFPTQVIDARQHSLRIFPLSELSRLGGADGTSRKLSLAFDKTEPFVFPMRDRESARQTGSELQKAKERSTEGLDRGTLFELDPLQPPAFTSPLAPQTPLVRRAPFWEKQRWALAILLGGALGIGFWRMRENLSDAHMFALAQAKGDAPAYRAYLQRGQQHRAEVSDVLLPRAELGEAQRQGSIEAIDAFMTKHPNSKIQDEVNAARHLALAAEFEQARRQGTLAALHAFAARHPNHGQEAELRAARKAVLKRALLRVKAGAPADAGETVEFAARLLAYCERVGTKSTKGTLRGPTVQIRFQRLPSESLRQADLALSKNPTFNGTVSFPTRYFDAEHLKGYERALSAKLIARFSELFPAEILVFEAGPLVVDEEKELSDVKTPALVFTERVEWTGGAYESKRPHGIFVGLIYLFRGAFLLPADPKPLRFKFNASEQIPVDVLKTHHADAGDGPLEEKVYRAMSSHAWDALADRYLARWVKPSG